MDCAAITEYLLAGAERQELRFYSLSSQIQRGGLDVTRWIIAFLGIYLRSLAAAEQSLASVLAKARFWRDHAGDDLNDHQRGMLNRFLEGFTGNLTSSKWAKICKVSQDTASREIRHLQELGILHSVGQGRSTHYCLTGIGNL